MAGGPFRSFQHFDYIFLNEFPAYFGKRQTQSSYISQNMLEIHSKICQDF